MPRNPEAGQLVAHSLSLPASSCILDLLRFLTKNCLLSEQGVKIVWF